MEGAPMYIGKGALYLAISQAVMLAAGYVIHVGVGRLLGPTSYGVFALSLSIITILSVALRSGFVAATSKFVAEKNSNAREVLARSLKMQILIGGAIFLALFVFAGAAAGLLGDATLEPYVRFVSLTIPVSTLYYVYTAALNGQRRFAEQMYAGIGYSLAKVIAAFGLLLAGFGLYGALFGYLLAPLAGFALAAQYVKVSRLPSGSKKAPTYSELAGFSIPLLFSSLVSSFSDNLDLFLAKFFLFDNAAFGAYAAAATLTRVPLFFVSASSAAFFPAFSDLLSRGETAAAGKHLEKGMRYVLILVAPVPLVLASLAGPVLSVIYSREYLLAASAFVMLSLSAIFRSLRFLQTAFINARGSTVFSLVLSLLLVLLMAAAGSVLIPAHGLIGVAASVTLASFAVVVLSWAYIARIAGHCLDLGSSVRVILAAAATGALAWALSGHVADEMSLAAVASVLAAVYFAFLWLAGAITKEDWGVLGRTLPQPIAARLSQLPFIGEL